jgi:NADPH2:quinone reductase
MVGAEFHPGPVGASRPQTSRKEASMPNLPPTMNAVAITAPGGPEVLKVSQAPTPKPGPGQVLIKVAAAGVNRPDVAQRAGWRWPAR